MEEWYGGTICHGSTVMEPFGRRLEALLLPDLRGGHIWGDIWTEPAICLGCAPAWLVSQHGHSAFGPCAVLATEMSENTSHPI